MYLDAQQCDLSREEFGRLTIRDLFTEFTAATQRRKHAIEFATFQAYQAVRIHWMTKAKKGRMPKFASLVGGQMTVDNNSSQAQASAMAEMLAAKTGSKVRVVKAGRN